MSHVLLLLKLLHAVSLYQGVTTTKIWGKPVMDTYPIHRAAATDSNCFTLKKLELQAVGTLAVCATDLGTGTSK